MQYSAMLICFIEPVKGFVERLAVGYNVNLMWNQWKYLLNDLLVRAFFGLLLGVSNSCVKSLTTSTKYTNLFYKKKSRLLFC